jgi:hypothetical protein
MKKIMMFLLLFALGSSSHAQQQYATNDVAKVYDTIMSIPDMNATVKIDLKISRKKVLLLNHVIERGLPAKDDDKAPAYFLMFLKRAFTN